PWISAAKSISRIPQFLVRSFSNKPWLDQDWPRKEQPVSLGSDSVTSRHIRNSDSPIDPNRKPSHLFPFYVVTVNYKSEHFLKQLIQSLASVDVLKELIIVDHSASVDLTALSAPFPIQVVVQENTGYGAGINRALRQIRNRDAFVLVCNPDVELLTPDTLPEALQYLQDNPQVACLAPSIVDRQLQPINSCRRFFTLSSIVLTKVPYCRDNLIQIRRHFYNDRKPDDIYEVEWASGCAIILNSSLFPYPLSFDEGFFLYYEDVDLCAQIVAHGLSIVRYPRMVLKHGEQRLSFKNWKHFKMHLRSLGKFIRKYRGFPQSDDLMNHGS
ncbi:MAG: glycosyltransferase family 2 protein, partial [Desulfomonile sp.]